jgi:hypothetical protein
VLCGAEGLNHALLVVLAASLALPAEARVRKKRKRPAPVAARAEDDPRRRGSSPAFARSSIAFVTPRDLAQHDDSAVEVRLQIKNYAIGAAKPGGPVPHAHLIVDNEPALEIDDATVSWALGGLSPGPHVLRAVLCRPWHEVVKAPRAFAMVRLWIGPRLPGKAGRAAEAAVWPNPRKPILTYVLPIGVPSKALVVARIEQDGAQAKEPDPSSPVGANRPVVDFYLSNARVGRRGDKVRIVLDRRELPLVTEWRPQSLRRAHGTHRIVMDLLNRKGLRVTNAINETARVFTIEVPPRKGPRFSDSR